MVLAGKHRYARVFLPVHETITDERVTDSSYPEIVSKADVMTVLFQMPFDGIRALLANLIRHAL